MKFSRERSIFAVSALAIILAAGIGVYMWVMRDPYAGLETHLEVQADEAVRTLAAQRIATAQASLEAMRKAGEKVPEGVYASIASDALILGDLVLARESLESAIQENSLNAATWNTYGYVLTMMHDYGPAKTAYLRAVELSPTEGNYRDAIKLLQSQFPQEQDTVKSLYEDSVDQLGQQMFNMLGLARWYAAAGDCARAKDHFSVAEALATTDEVRQQVVDEAKTTVATCKSTQ